MYQPIPFKGYEGIPVSRIDCEKRWIIVHAQLISLFGSLERLSLVDVGAAECFFPFRFLQEGGREARGVEIEPGCRLLANQIAEDDGLSKKFHCAAIVEELGEEQFDIGIYFDLHYHEGIDFLKWFSEHTENLFCSPAGKGDETSKRMFFELAALYSYVCVIGESICNRKIFLCRFPK